MKDKLVRKIMKNLKPIDKSKKYLVALSGGADSTLLLTILVKLGFEVSAAHVHHNVRSESDWELIFCEDLCKKLNIPFFSTKLEFEENEKKNQDTYRKKRYKFLLDVYKENGFSGVFLGQHFDDQVENAIVSFFNRKSVLSLKAMETESELYGMNVYRPLLNARKHEILEAAKRHNIQYVTDNSNFEETYERNKVRLSLVPLAEKIFGAGIFKTLEQMIQSAKEQEETNEYYSKKLIEKYWNGKELDLNCLEEHSEHIFVFSVDYILKTKGVSADKASYNDLKNLLKGNKSGCTKVKGCSIVLKNKKLFFE